MRRRQRTKWEPVCSWCHRDLIGEFQDTPWRTPMYGGEGMYAQGLMARVVVCDPDCPERPPGAEVFRARPSIEALKSMSRADRDLAIAGTL